MINKEAQEAWEAGYLAGKGLIKEAAGLGGEIGASYLSPILTTGLSGLAGAGIGGMINGKTGAGIGGIIGTSVGGGLSVAANLAAHASAAMSETRTKNEQREVDKQSFVRNLIPGVASYNFLKRLGYYNKNHNLKTS